VTLQADMTTAADPLVLPAVGGVFKSGDIAMIYNCDAKSYFQVTGFAGGVMTHTATGGTPGNTVDTLSHTYFAGAEVVPVNTVVYYIQASTTPGVRSLFRKVGGGQPEELVEGIDQMQIDYGVDTDGNDAIDTYVTANNVTDWESVLSVRVALLVESVDQYGTESDTKQYQLLSDLDAVTVLPPMDRRYREVFTATVGIRNKVVIN
jgi:type IV pilus assembly protein PilW